MKNTSCILAVVVFAAIVFLAVPVLAWMIHNALAYWGSL